MILIQIDKKSSLIFAYDVYYESKAYQMDVESLAIEEQECSAIPSNSLTMKVETAG